MIASPPFVDVDGLTFRYRRASEPAIRDISLTISEGEVILVAGPSGCGKSTLIRALNGLIPHSYRGELSGTVRLRGREVAAMPLRETSLIVGTVLQDPARQIVGATVETELAFGPENLGLPRGEIRNRIRLVAARARIEHLVGRETAELSGGERQLLAMAGILMMQPQLFVVDEPLANLDPATAATLLATLRELADEGHAVVLVEHRVEEALELEPDRVLYLEEGRTRYLGPVEGFLKVADPGSVKLPFEAILARARAGEVEVDDWSPPSPQPAGGNGAAPLDRLAYERVRAGYGEREVLHGVSAALRPSETVAVLGPNGSGKTTLFKAAMRLIEPTSGTVRVDGASTDDRTVADLARVFGYVFQSPSQMLFARSVREELAYGPRNLGMDPAGFDDLIADVLARVGLADEDAILERAPQTLSFGQQKRLAIAIALALRPKTLILDEPSAGQDHRNAREFMRAVRTIPGLESIYFVTHDVDLALTHADRILLFRDGRIVADGPPRLVVEDEDRWIQCNLRPTSLMRANAQRGAPGSRFLEAESLARRLARS
ncbi:MAG TPA: ABC transporter ATP-binding protein [Candidatus Limnocylindrales bacterium]|nr:ABC transporter ATP-binding protein [Candidatus Limnocylindrales bacterium]